MRCEAARGLVQRDGGHESEARGGRIVRREAYQGARIEVSGRRDPGPPLPPLAARLPVGAEPQSLGCAAGGAGEEVVVGGAGLGDVLDRQWALGLLKTGEWRSESCGAIDAAASLVIASK